MAEYINYESLLSLGGTVKSYIDENDIGIEVSNGSVQIFSKWDVENNKWSVKSVPIGSKEYELEGENIGGIIRIELKDITDGVSAGVAIVDISGKQDVLTAGSGISIVDNVISAVGSGSGEMNVIEDVRIKTASGTYVTSTINNKMATLDLSALYTKINNIIANSISVVGDEIASIVDASGTSKTIKNNIEAMSGAAVGFTGLTFNW